MRFICDQDYHIHSSRSFCSHDETQTPLAILQKAKEQGLKKICLTDHFWDEAVPGIPGLALEQNYANISVNLPLPRDEEVEFHFGCETDMDKRFVLGVAPEHYDRFDFIIISTTHLHLPGFTVDEGVDEKERVRLYIERFRAVLNMDLPFRKVGIAHLTTNHITRGKQLPGGLYSHLDVIDGVSDETFRELFCGLREKGGGVEINFDLNYYKNERDVERSLRPYLLAKECGCKFYMGSDVHKFAGFEWRMQNFERNVDALGLTEDDKFRPFG